MIPTRVYLPEETKDALRTLAEERDTSQSALIREALDAFLPSGNARSEGERIDESFGIWRDRENIHQEFRQIRESMDRDVWARVRDYHGEDSSGEQDDG